MLGLEFNQLPQHHQKLYKLLVSAIAGAFLVGGIWILLGFSDQRPLPENEWQPTSVPPSDDVMGQFARVAESPRWFAASGSKAQVGQSQDPLKAMEGKPESLRLTGLVAKGDKTYALFLPLTAPADAGAKPAIRQLGEGDTLVGEWVVKRIGHNQVEIQQGDETQIIKMYQPKTK